MLWINMFLAFVVTLLVRLVPCAPQVVSVVKNVPEESIYYDEIVPSSTYRSNKQISESPRAEMYLECFHTRGCVATPTDCIGSRTCLSMISYVKEDEYIRFEILGPNRKYIAMGISSDPLMGDDSVVECVKEVGDRMGVYTSWNSFNSVTTLKTNKRLTKHDTILHPVAKIEDGYMYCTFLMKLVTKINGKTFNLEKEQFYLLGADGSQAYDGLIGNLQKHDSTYRSETRFNLYTHVGKSPGLIAVQNTHGVLMIIIWTLVMPTGSFFARYFKETFINYYIRGSSLWFALHFIAMISTLVLTFVSVIAICLTGSYFPGSKGWTFHAITGVALLCFLVAQTPSAYGIMKFNSKNKYLFVNYIHGIFGHVLFFLGYTCIFNSRDLRDGLPCDADVTLIVWIVIYFIIHICMSYQVCYSDFVQGRQVSRTYTLGPLDIPDRGERGKEEPGALARKILLGVFIGVSAIFSLVLIIQYMMGEMVDCAAVSILKKDGQNQMQD